MLLVDLLRLVASGLQSHRRLAAENLVLRKQLALYLERRVKPRRADGATRSSMVVLSRMMKWGHLQENPARGVDMPKLKTVRPKWALTTRQAAALLGALAPLPKTIVGLAILSGLRRGELFALRWQDIDEPGRLLTVREAVYDGAFLRQYSIGVVSGKPS